MLMVPTLRTFGHLQGLNSHTLLYSVQGVKATRPHQDRPCGKLTPGEVRRRKALLSQRVTPLSDSIPGIYPCFPSPSPSLTSRTVSVIAGRITASCPHKFTNHFPVITWQEWGCRKGQKSITPFSVTYPLLFPVTTQGQKP